MSLAATDPAMSSSVFNTKATAFAVNSFSARITYTLQIWEVSNAIRPEEFKVHKGIHLSNQDPGQRKVNITHKVQRALPY